MTKADARRIEGRRPRDAGRYLVRSSHDYVDTIATSTFSSAADAMAAAAELIATNEIAIPDDYYTRDARVVRMSVWALDASTTPPVVLMERSTFVVEIAYADPPPTRIDRLRGLLLKGLASDVVPEDDPAMEPSVKPTRKRATRQRAATAAGRVAMLPSKECTEWAPKGAPRPFNVMGRAPIDRVRDILLRALARADPPDDPSNPMPDEEAEAPKVSKKRITTKSTKTPKRTTSRAKIPHRAPASK